MSALTQWMELVEAVNGRTTMGQVGVRDPGYPCEAFDGAGYDGYGRCESDGHYLCTACSKLSPNAPRFHERDGRRDRLRLFLRSRRPVRTVTFERVRAETGR